MLNSSFYIVYFIFIIIMIDTSLSLTHEVPSFRPMEGIKKDDSWTPPFMFTPFHNYPHLDSSLNSVDNTFDHNSEDYVKSLSLGGYLMFFVMLLCALMLSGIYFLFVRHWLKTRSFRGIGNKYHIVRLLTIICAGIVLVGLLLELLFYFVTMSKLATDRELLVPGAGDFNSKKFPTFENTYRYCMYNTNPGGAYMIDDNCYYKWDEYRIDDAPFITEEMIKEDFQRVTEICQWRKDKVYACLDYMKKWKVKKKPMIVDALNNPFPKYLHHRGYHFAKLACGWLITLLALLLLLTCLDMRIMFLVGVILALIFLCMMAGLLTAEAMAISDACQAPNKLLRFLEKKKAYNTTVDGPEPDCVQWYKDRNEDLMQCMFNVWKYHDCIVENADMYPAKFYQDHRVVDYKDTVGHTVLRCQVNDYNTLCPSPTGVTATRVYDTRGTLHDFCGYGSEFWIVLLQFLGVIVAAAIMSILLGIALTNIIRKRNLDGQMRSDFDSLPAEEPYRFPLPFRTRKGKFLKGSRRRAAKRSKFSETDNNLFKKSKTNVQEIPPVDLVNDGAIRPYIDDNSQQPVFLKCKEFVPEPLLNESGTSPYKIDEEYQPEISNRQIPDNMTEEARPRTHTRRSHRHKTSSKYRTIPPAPQPLTPKSSPNAPSYLQEFDEYPTTDYSSAPIRRRLSHKLICEPLIDYGYQNSYDNDIMTSETSPSSPSNIMKNSAQTYNQYRSRQNNVSSSNDCPTFDWDASSPYASKDSESDLNYSSESSSDTNDVENMMRDVDCVDNFHNSEYAAYFPYHRERIFPPTDINDRSRYSRGSFHPRIMYNTGQYKTPTHNGTPALCCSCPTCQINKKSSRKRNPVSYFEYRLDSKTFKLKTYMKHQPISIQLNSSLDTPSSNDMPSTKSKGPQNLAVSAAPVQVSVSPLCQTSGMHSSSLEITFSPTTSAGPSVTSNSLSDSGCRLNRQQCYNPSHMDLTPPGSTSMPNYSDTLAPTPSPDCSTKTDDHGLQHTHCRRSSPGYQDVKPRRASTANQNPQPNGTLELAASERSADVLRLMPNQAMKNSSYQTSKNTAKKRGVHLELPATSHTREHVLDETEEDKTCATPQQHSENEEARLKHDKNSSKR